MTAITMSFANNFWGKDDAGVDPLLQRMSNAKQTCDELKSFYNARAALEDEYARKLLQLSRKALGSQEAGTLRASLDVLRGEVEQMGKAHQTIAGQMKTELEEPLAAFAGAMKERRKIVQGGIEKLHKTKIQQTITVNKTRDRYEQECLKIKGYLAQGHMVMGQEERKNKAKLEKTQINLATSNTEYEAAVKVLEETTGRWNREWKAAADKFQDLEEERLDFMKSSLWSFANIASTVCVSDDASCEKVRLSLENCEVEKDIISFIKEQGTGQEIPDAPKYINFCRGDVTDTQSMTSNEDEDAYSVAQFQRTINPSYRSSSPQPSTFESHHDPNSVLARELGHREASGATMTPQSALADRTRNIHQEAARLQFEQSKQGPSSAVAHDPYPMDGMTMLCRPGPPSDMSSARSAGERPSSRDSHSEYSNPTSFSSMEGPSGKSSPVKQHQQDMVLSPVSEKSVAKKKSGFFNSPFKRKKSIRDLNNNMNHSSTPTASSSWNSPQTTPGRQGYGGNMLTDARSASPEPVDPRASFQLNVGNNVFDVATPGQRSKTSPNSPANPLNDLDPIAQALADLKGVTKQSSVRMSADMYHGIATPAPGQQGNRTGPPLRDGALMAGMRGTPPPSYDQPVSRLGAPQPAFTSKAMQASTQKYVSQTRDVFASPSQQRPQSRGNGNMAQPGRPQSRGGDMPRATSPLPMRGASPRPFNNDNRGPPNNAHRSPSPNPYSSASRQPQHSRPQSYANTPTRGSGPNMNQNGSRYGSPAGDMRRSASPAPYANMQHDRSNSEMGMQLAQPREGDYGSQSRGRGGHMRSMTGGAPAGRPQSSYGGQGMAVAPAGRERSKSVAAPTQFTKDGRPVLHFARAMYSYSAAIPEELTFAKGDVLAVLRLQDDGWWEAEVAGKGQRPGLVPSNYLQKC